MGRRKFDPLEHSKNNPAVLSHEITSVCDNKAFFALRIKELRLAAKISQAELAHRLGLTRSAILNWETGRTRPDISNLPALCQALNLPVSDFFTANVIGIPEVKDERQLLSSYRAMNDGHKGFLLKMARELEALDNETSKKRARIHLLKLPYAEDAVAAGIGTQGFEAACSHRYMHSTPLLQETDILFHVNGDSMEPQYPHGCVVMVKESTDVKTGDIAVFSVDGTLYIKEYQQDGLHSLNPAYPPMLSTRYPDIQVIGRVIGIADQEDFATEAEIRAFEGKN